MFAMACDILYRDGRDLTARPLVTAAPGWRTSWLAANWSSPCAGWRRTASMPGGGVLERGYEGLVAKDSASVYEPAARPGRRTVLDRSWSYMRRVRTSSTHPHEQQTRRSRLKPCRITSACAPLRTSGSVAPSRVAKHGKQ
jgi:hypothetical protein